MKAAPRLFFSVLSVMTAIGIIYGALPAIALTAVGDPVVSNVRSSQRAGTKLVDVLYDLTDADSPSVNVIVQVSTNSGLTYDLPANHFSGNGYGAGVTPGTNKAVVWDAGADYDGQYCTTMRLKITADDGSNPVIPPDPSTVATSPSNGVATLLHDATAFLYTGTNLIQSGVAAGTISTTQVAVLRGRVLDQAGSVLSGVVVSVNSRPEFGWTVSRTNGGYDMAVNGGGTLNLNYRKTGYLALQRTLDVPWQDYVNVNDVRLLTADTNDTVLLLPGSNMQVARGGIVSDSRGTRRATLLVPSNVTASIITYQGTTQQVNSLTTRFTEYTVGTNGLESMPGELPPTVAYTYAMNLGADEAQAKVAGKDVLFNASVYYYLDNFLGFSPGTPAPHGYYDNDVGAWVPTPDGWVLQLMGTNAAGLARICLSTNIVEADAATLATFGFTDEERRILAQIYPSVTNSLWRIPITHFSCGDVNWPLVAARPGATSPQLNLSSAKDNREDKPATRSEMGTIEIENRVFRETMPIVGTPFTLNYASNPGTGFPSLLTIPLSGAVLPNGLTNISLNVSVAGTIFANTFAAETNLQYEFSWNGKDVYGRALAGEQPVRITVGYAYEAYYGSWLLTTNINSFGQRSWEVVYGNVRTLFPVWYYQSYATTIGSPPSPKDLGVGGWTFNVQHSYDPVSKTIFLGDGRTRQAENFRNFRVITTMAGNGTNVWYVQTDNGSMATGVAVKANGLAYGRDGTIYLSEFDWVRQIRPDGRIYNFASRLGAFGDFSGDGGAATNANLNGPRGLCVGPDGSVYIADTGNHRIRRVDTNGIITTVAGNGTAAWSGDGGPATNASLSSPRGVAAAEDGTLYVADADNYRVRMVMPDQTIYTLAGNGSDASTGDGGVSTNAAIGKPYDVACDLHGNVYIASWSQLRARKVDLHGIISTVAGGGSASWSEGMAATNANLGSLNSVAISPDGVLYIADGGRDRVRQVSPLGFITTLAGNGTYDTNRVAVGDNGPAPNAKLYEPYALTLSPNGDLYISDYYHYRIRQILPSLPSLSYSDLFISSEDGSVIYQFSPDGRHLRTLHALTGEALLTFGYAAGRLMSITDGDGNVTTITRDASGKPTAIVSPYDQHTTVTLTGDGCLSTLVNPAGETTSFTYTNGLLASVTGARGPSYTYTVTYDAGGRVMRGADPAGGYTAISKSSWSNDYLACSTTAMGRTSSILSETLTSDARRRTETLPDGTVSRSEEYLNGVSSNWLPSGIIYSKSTGPDPRFGMQAPVDSCTLIRTPAGLLVSNTVARAITLTNSLLGVGTYTVTNVQNGCARTTTFTGPDRQVNVTSPAGRQNQIWLDGQGRMIRQQISGFNGVTNVYDSHGRLSSTRVGDRITTYAYDSDGYLQTKTDALGRTNTFVYDPAGRVTTGTLPGSRTVSYGYDAHGNMTSITPPDKSAHSFAYNLVDLPSEYTPPAMEGVTNTTCYTYNADRQMTSIRKPGGLTISNDYNAAGQLSAVTIPNTTYTYYWQTNGLLGGVIAASGVGITNEYDGSLVTATRWSGSVTGRVSRTYDNDFRVASLSVNGANMAACQYDADSLMTNAGLCAFSRNAANGLLTGCTLSNVMETLSYNGFGEITNLTVTCNGTNLFVVNYMFDRLGRITNLAETIQGTNRGFGYTYDSAGRLAQVVTNATGTNFYYYDGNGNRTNWQVAGIVSAASNDAQDRLQSSVSSLQTNVYAYNAAGDLTNKTSNGSNTMYQYDALGNLLSVTLPAGRTNEYLVDGRNSRVGKKVNGVLTNGFLYADQLNPIAELDGNMSVVSVFVYGSRPNVPDYMVRGGVAYRIISDHLGSPRLVVQAETGEVVQRMDYDEFGRVALDTNPGFQPFGFAGGLYDSTIGLVRFGARDYDSDTGRWTAKDPILFLGGDANLYCYVMNNPINQLDVNGLGPNQSRVPVATVFANEGKVYIRRGGSGPLQRAEPGTPIYEGDVVITAPGSAAGVEYTIGGKVGIGETSGVRITGDRQYETIYAPPHQAPIHWPTWGNGGVTGPRG